MLCLICVCGCVRAWVRACVLARACALTRVCARVAVGGGRTADAHGNGDGDGDGDGDLRFQTFDRFVKTRPSSVG